MTKTTNKGNISLPIIILSLAVVICSFVVFLLLQAKNPTKTANKTVHELTCEGHFKYGSESTSTINNWCTFSLNYYAFSFPKEWTPYVVGAWATNMSLKYGTNDRDNVSIEYTIQKTNTSKTDMERAKSDSTLKVEEVKLKDYAAYRVKSNEIISYSLYNIKGIKNNGSMFYPVIVISSKDLKMEKTLDKIVETVIFSENNTIDPVLLR